MDEKMTRLREALKLRNEQLLKLTESLVDRATPQLWHTWSTFQSGTKHTKEHTDTVEKIASMLLSDDILAKMNDDEIALLILACHFHDLGMAGTEEDNATQKGRDRVRKEHAISIGEKISQHWRELGFDDQNYAEVLAEVCRGHRPDKLDGEANWNNLSEHRNIGPSRFVRLRLISSMIYAADELHLGHDRAPKREEEWKEITNTESLRHWRRHQAVSGPTKPFNDIVFDVRINTPSFEKDIRKCLRKALTAVEDMRRELNAIGLKESIPQIRIIWLRDALWKLLITQVCSDGIIRSKNEISGEVLTYFEDGETKYEDLRGLCLEQPVDVSEIQKEIERAISDFISRDYLIEDGNLIGFKLSSEVRVSKNLLKLTRDADETDQLFARAIDASHEQSYYESETGKLFIRQYIFSEIQKSYAVDVAQAPEDDPLRVVIESSPMSCRILQQLSTPPGTLVKHDLLQFAVTVGICFDLINKPELYLDKSLRTAISSLFENTIVRIPRFKNFIQELAIIKNLSFDQVASIVSVSLAEKNEYFSDSGKKSINLSQKFPLERPDWSVPYLLLASHRSQEAITILNTPDAPFHITTELNNESDSVETSSNVKNTELISFAPVTRNLSKTISFRASISFDPLKGVLVFSCQKLNNKDQSDLPVIVTVPSEKPENEFNVTFSFPFTLLNVGHLLDLENATNLSLEGDLEVRIMLEGTGLITKNIHSPSNPFKHPEIISKETITSLAEIDRAIPLPAFSRKGLLKNIIRASPKERLAQYEEAKILNKKEKPSVTSIFVRLATSEEQDFREEFLGVLPMEQHFMPPKIVESKMKQEEVDHFCELGEQRWMLRTLFREDFHTLSQELRDWMADPEEPFPFKNDNDLQFHYCKTCMEQVHEKHIDRFWYIERPVVFRFYPVDKAEQYRVEMEYWQSEGDNQRVELLAELVAEEEEKINRTESETCPANDKPQEADSNSENKVCSDEKEKEVDHIEKNPWFYFRSNT